MVLMDGMGAAVVVLAEESSTDGIVCNIRNSDDEEDVATDVDNNKDAMENRSVGLVLWLVPVML
jgi:hypothetical protein